jgi:hypothetical protein
MHSVWGVWLAVLPRVLRVQLLILHHRGLVLFLLGVFLSVWTDGERGPPEPLILCGNVSAPHIALTAIVPLGLVSLIATLRTLRKYTRLDPDPPPV